jgi:hypothetical protein
MDRGYYLYKLSNIQGENLVKKSRIGKGEWKPFSVILENNQCYKNRQEILPV